MQTIKLKRGLDIPFEGTAAETLGSVRRPEVFHIVPDQSLPNWMSRSATV